MQQELIERYKNNYLFLKLAYIEEEYKKHQENESLDLNNLYYCYTFSNELESIAPSENKKLEEIRLSYANRIERIKRSLNIESIEETINFYNRLYNYQNEELFKTLALAFYLVKKNKGTQTEKDIIELLKIYKYDKETTIVRGKDNKLVKISNSYELATTRYTLFNFLFRNIEVIETYKEANIVKDEEDNLKGIYTPTELELLDGKLDNILEAYETIEAIKHDLVIASNTPLEELEALKESKEVENIINDAKKELTKEKTIDFTNLIDAKTIKDIKDYEKSAEEIKASSRHILTEDIINYIYNLFSIDPGIRKALIKPLELEPNIIKEELDITKEERRKKALESAIEEPIGQTTPGTEERIEPLSQEVKEQAIKELKEDPNKVVYIQVGNSKELTNVHNAFSQLHGQLEPTLYKKKKELSELVNRRSELESKKNRTSEEIKDFMMLDEIIRNKELELKDLEEEKAERSNRIKALEKDLAETEEEIKSTKSYKLDKIVELDNKARKIRKNLKSERKILEEESKENKYIQLALDERTGTTIISATDGSVNASIEVEQNLEYSIENERLTNYIENYYFTKPPYERSNNISFTLGQYADFYGLEPSSYLKASIKADANNKYKANMRFIEDTEHYKRETQFRLLQAQRITEYKDYKEKHELEKNASREDRIEIIISDIYKEMLELSGKNYIALLPKEINKLASNPKTHKAFELANYIYKVIVRNNVKNGITNTGIGINRKVSTYIEALEKKGAFQKNSTNKYSRRIIEPLRNAFNDLQDLGIIELTEEEDTNPFIYYDNETNKKKAVKDFKDRNIIIFIKVIPNEYKEIYNNYRDYSKKANKHKATRK